MTLALALVTVLLWGLALGAVQVRIQRSGRMTKRLRILFPATSFVVGALIMTVYEWIL